MPRGAPRARPGLSLRSVIGAILGAFRDPGVLAGAWVTPPLFLEEDPAEMTTPSVADFKARFSRDFLFGGTDGDLSTVQDSDVQNAIDDAAALINPALFSAQGEYATAYLFLAAHFLVTNIKNSTAGLSGAGSNPWLVQSKGAGPVSVSFAIPQEITQSPLYAMLTLTPYGLRYLQTIVGLLAGNVGCVAGATQP